MKVPAASSNHGFNAEAAVPAATNGDTMTSLTHLRPVRSLTLAVTLAATLVTAVACSSSKPSAAPATTRPDAAPSSTAVPDVVEATELARARAGTARYATDLEAAQVDGYQIITPMMPDMGVHFLNPAIKGFEIDKPPILVYVHNGGGWQLGALEWVFPEKPATPPLDGATYGTFGAACHYSDGTFVFADAQPNCASTSPGTGSPFVFWHPPFVTMHVWLWYPNPAGLFSSTNPLITPFNQPDQPQNPSGASRLDDWAMNHGA
jgi:hypothetical protein